MSMYQLEMRHGRCTTVDGVPLVLAHWKNVRPKYCVYIVRRDEEIIYVGETGRGVYRCLHALRSTHGTDLYDWRNERDVRNASLELMVISPDMLHYQQKQAEYRKAVEADVAYVLRHSNGAWPSKLRGLTPSAHIHRGVLINRAVDSVVDALKKMRWL